MVKIAIFGASSGIAQEVVDVLAETKKHNILLLSRKDPPVDEARSGVTWVKTDYGDVEALVTTLQGVHTVLSFVVAHLDVGNVAQKNVINAAIRAGVKRFAPSEWVSPSFDHMVWYDNKEEVRKYLAELNKEKKVLEYSLFQPGMLMNYFTPSNGAKHITPIRTPIDFNDCQALIVEGREDSRISLITVQDLANVVARAVEYPGEWPVIGGIRGTELPVGQLVALGEKIRGKPFTVEKLKAEDLEAGKLESAWLPAIAVESAFPDEQAEALIKRLVTGLVLGISVGALKVSDEWNHLLPDYKFAQAEDFLGAAWSGEP